MSDLFWYSYSLLWLLVFALSAVVLICVRQLGEVYLRSAGIRGVAGDGIPIGRTAPNFLIKCGGSIDTLRKALPRGGLLLFASYQCDVCRELVPQIITQDGSVPTVILYDQIRPGGLDQGAGSSVVVAEMVDENVPLRYKVRVTPFLFALDDRFRVKSRGLVNKLDQVALHAQGLADSDRSKAVAPAEHIGA